MGYVEVAPSRRVVGKHDGDICIGATSIGASRLSCFLSLSNPQPICALRENLALVDRTNFELVMLLTDQNWHWRPLPSKRADRLALLYKNGKPQLWYSLSDTPNRHYMIALLSAAEIFAKGHLSLFVFT